MVETETHPVVSKKYALPTHHHSSVAKSEMSWTTYARKDSLFLVTMSFCVISVKAHWVTLNRDSVPQ